VLITLRAH
jgi:hypothetical protein